MRILITGGSGFVGWNAVRYFAARGHDVVATFYTFSHYLHCVAGVQPVQLDITDGSAIEREVARFQPHIILHTAAHSRPQESGDAGHVTAVNVQGTAHLARAAQGAGSTIIYLSTDLVYGADAGCCDENTPVSPSGAGVYAESKLAGEEAVRESGADWIAIRCALMFGDGTPRSRSFTQFMDRSWESGVPAPLFTDQYRSMLYVGDLVRGVEQVGFLNPQRNQLYVCGGPHRMSRAEFGLLYAETCGVSQAMCNPMRAGELEGYIGGSSDIWLDTTKLQTTGWRPRSLRQAFQEMLGFRNTELL